MSRITIVSGCPGCGKTTLARALAESSKRGLHLSSDDFYAYPGHLIPPTEPASKHQNETILRAVARAASAFAEGGYDVAVDGVIGPWMLPVVRPEFGDPDELLYLVLRCDLERAQRRVHEREGAGASAVVEQMHAAFANLGALEDCSLDTTGRSPEQVRDEFEARAARGEFRLGGRREAG